MCWPAWQDPDGVVPGLRRDEYRNTGDYPLPGERGQAGQDVAEDRTQWVPGGQVRRRDEDRGRVRTHHKASRM